MEHITAKMGAATLNSDPPQPKHSNVYVSNLPPTLQTEQDITALFSEYGRVETCRLVRSSRDTKSFAFVKFATIPESLAAIAGLNKKTVGGAALEVKTADAGKQGCQGTCQHSSHLGDSLC
jgi:RNA recognition motif-containing protein